LSKHVTKSLDHLLDARAVAGITPQQIENIVSQACAQVADRLVPAPADVRRLNVAPGDAVFKPNAYLMQTSKRVKWSRLPPNFQLPNGSLQSAWICYLCYDERNRLPPLRFVDGAEMNRSLSGEFTKYRKLMEALIQKAKDLGFWVDVVDQTDALDIFKHFNLSEIFPTTTPKGRARRLDQLKWETLANDFYNHRTTLVVPQEQVVGEENPAL